MFWKFVGSTSCKGLPHPRNPSSSPSMLTKKWNSSQQNSRRVVSVGWLRAQVRHLSIRICGDCNILIERCLITFKIHQEFGIIIPLCSWMDGAPSSAIPSYLFIHMIYCLHSLERVVIIQDSLCLTALPLRDRRCSVRWRTKRTATFPRTLSSSSSSPGNDDATSLPLFSVIRCRHRRLAVQRTGIISNKKKL